MKDILNRISEQELRLFKKLGKAADQLEMDAYVVGGFVRDKIMQRPSADVDVVCIGDGIKLAKAFAKQFSPSLNVAYFKNFGTAQVKYLDWEIEFVGARKESYTLDSRKPEVTPGTLKDDQLRRDFTINAMAMCLNSKDFGRLLDPFNGVEDIDKKIIKTPLEPNATFSDDPLRMMRAVRFASQLNFELHDTVKTSLLEMAFRLEIVSKERIMKEFHKILATPKPSRGILLLDEHSLLNQFLPELPELKGVDIVNGIGHKDNFYHTLEVLDNICEATNNIWLRWSAILHDIAKPPTKKFVQGEGWTFHGHEILGASMVYDIFKRLKLPLDNKMKFVQKLVKLHLRPMAIAKSEVTDSAVRRLLFDSGEDLEGLMTLCRADITSKKEWKVKKYLANYDRVMNKIREVEERDKIRNWEPPIDGALIMNTFNLKPSKEVGIIKSAIREAILEGDIKNDYDEAFNFMIKKGKELGLEKA